MHTNTGLSPVKNNKREKHHIVLDVVFAVLAALFVVIVSLNWHEFVGAIYAMRPRYIIAAFTTAAIAYAAAGIGFSILGSVLGIRVKRTKLVKINAITSAVSRLTSIGGVTGYAVRALIMKREGVDTRDTVVASLYFSYLYTLTVTILMALGLTYMIFVADVHVAAKGAIALAALIFSAIFAILSVFLFNPILREKIFKAVSRFRIFSHWLSTREKLESFNGAFANATNLMRKNKPLVAGSFAFVLLDVMLGALVMLIALRATGAEVPAAIALASFFVSVVVGLLSMVPGGMGSQDASFAGLLVLSGVAVGNTIAATLIFRIVYYIIPFGIALVVYRRIRAADDCL